MLDLWVFVFNVDMLILIRFHRLILYYFAVVHFDSVDFVSLFDSLLFLKNMEIGVETSSCSYRTTQSLCHVYCHFRSLEHWHFWWWSFGTVKPMEEPRCYWDGFKESVKCRHYFWNSTRLSMDCRQRLSGLAHLVIILFHYDWVLIIKSQFWLNVPTKC